MTWNSVERQTFSNIGATTAAFTLRGGQYGVDVNFTGTSITLQKLSQDGTNYVTALTAFTGAGYATVNLPSGTYRFLLTSASAAYIALTGIVTTM